MMIRLLQVLLLLFSVINAEHPCKAIRPTQPDVIAAVRSFRNAEHIHSSELDDDLFTDDSDDEIEMKNLKYAPRLLPPRALGKKKTLVLDMDETMVYAGSNWDYQADFEFALNGGRIKVRVKKRPGLDHFLQVAAQDFELVVFTAALKKYADQVLNRLDPNDVLFSHRLYRDSCTIFNGKRVKDLYRLGRPMDSVLILDNSINALELVPENSIPISSYFGEDPDDGLGDSLLNLLDEFKNYSGDIRDWTYRSREIEERMLEAVCERKCRQLLGFDL